MKILATVTLATCATGLGWALAKVLSCPDHETGDAPLFADELAERRRQQAKALHPSAPSVEQTTPYRDGTVIRLGNVVPFRTPDQAS